MHLHSYGILHLIGAYGYAFIFLGTFFEGELVVIAAAFLSRIGVVNFWAAMLAAFLGAISGDNFWYLVGRYGGVRFLHRRGRIIGITEERIAKAHAFFEKYGEKTVFFARFVFGARLTTAMVAGSSEMPERNFLIANVSGALVWVGLVGSLGYLFGKSFKTLAILVKRAELLLLILAILAIIILILRLKRRSKK